MSQPTRVASELPRAARQAGAPAVEGLLIVGHGTRDPRGQAEMQAVVERVAARLPGVPCQGCSLEFATPTIAEGVSLLSQRGVERIVAMPLLLFAAGHVKEDIPAALAAASAQAGGIPIEFKRYLGCHPALVELAVKRCEEALARAGVGEFGGRSQTLLLMVGRGSRDPEANAEMAQFARLVFERVQPAWLEVCFTALAEPLLARGLEFAGATRFPQIVVQPHLLFPGELLERVRRWVEPLPRMTGKHWLLAEHLGVDALLVDAIVSIAGIRC
ncbi:MAG: sirohydrochlorin chelatase [Planctomycetaceae bacterium]|nr:sirohydrochlorin chelatase [Planctomycetaceae bacterium]